MAPTSVVGQENAVEHLRHDEVKAGVQVDIFARNDEHGYSIQTRCNLIHRTLTPQPCRVVNMFSGLEGSITAAVTRPNPSALMFCSSNDRNGPHFRQNDTVHATVLQ